MILFALSDSISALLNCVSYTTLMTSTIINI